MARRSALVAILAAALTALLATAPTAWSAVSCPNPNPIVQENNCVGAGTSAWQLSNANENIGGFSTKSTFARGENVPLKIARNAPLFPATRVDISVYRMGYYGGAGGRLIAGAGATGVTVNNTQTCNAPDTVTGRLDCGNWAVTYTVPGASLPATGVYLAKLRTTDTGLENWILFIVRDDARTPAAKVEFVVPTSTYEAYNTWGGKSLYFDRGFGQGAGGNTIAGTDRAVKVSFNRPMDDPERFLNRFPNGPDADLVYWFEKQGYDMAYTDDLQVALNPDELKQRKVVTMGAHSEYWAGEAMSAYKAARNVGTSILSLGGNTGYWKVRYEDGGRTLVCYKTVAGTGSSGSGAAGVNDPGPDKVQGTADDALGADGVAGTADDRPQNSTTTFRDNGAPPGDANAPPNGRVGPDEPENSLLGNMYFGDNDSFDYPLTVPAANGNAEFAGDRVWRNTGLPTNIASSITTNAVGWEWDGVPTQAQYLSRQPANVKRISSTATTSNTPNWLQDEGRAYTTTPPPGSSGTVSAVKYRATSGAWVFAAGTNNWGRGMVDDSRIGQATYNLVSDMGVQPATPASDVTLDPGGSNQPPSATFAANKPNPLPLNQAVSFNGSQSTDADGTIVKYEWDLGTGTFVSTGTTSTTSRTFTAEGTYDVRLRVTDNLGATDTTTQTLDVLGNRPPVAAFTATPNPAIQTQTVTFDASGTTDPDGTITKYEWDLDGNGTYETNAGTTKTATTSYGTAGTVTVALRVTDNGGKTATMTLPVTVNTGGLSHYGDAVLDTPGLLSYWRLGETSGPSFADSAGTSAGTTVGGTTFGAPGAVAADPNTALSFDGIDDAGRANLDLSSASTITVEFWLKWNAYANNDALAMEFTPNFNDNAGGFLVDPNAPQNNGTFGIGIGSGSSRNNAFFPRPSAGAWHHYALVLDATAPAATQITPYVDGQAVAYSKTASGTGMGAFASSALNLMSRNGNQLLGAGSLDEVAIYNRALSAVTINEHFRSFGTNRRPVARFTASPNPVKPNTSVTLNASTSTDTDGTITRYQWDLDGNGTYETDGGSNPQRTTSYPTAGNRTISLRVTDDGFGADTTTGDLFVGDKPPTPRFTATPNPALVDLPVTFDGSTSTDVDGTITKYEWDLDGNGSFEADTGTTKTAVRSFSSSGAVTVGLRVTDSGGNTASTTVPVTINSGGSSNYGDTILDTAGVVGYWRLGEPSGTALADSKGTATGTAAGGVTLGVPGAVSGDPNTATRYDGVNDAAAVPVNLSGTSQATVSFWLKWNQYANDDALAMEFTPNFNDNAGGFLVDPNAPQSNGTFGVGIGSGSSRNNVFFARPSAGAWHHYAFVMDTTAPAATQITPYVDGQAVGYTKSSSGTGAGAFANSVLNLMSRNGAALFGKGDLDEVAVFNRALSAAAINEQFTSTGANRRPTAVLGVSPNPVKTSQTVTFSAAGSSDPDGTITRYQWDLDGNGSFETDTGSTPTATRSYSTVGDVTVKLRVLDDAFGSDVESAVLSVGNRAPTAAFSISPSPALAGSPVTFDASASSDSDGTITKYEWDLDGNGSFETDTGTSATTTRTFASAATLTVGLRVTDSDGALTTTTKSLTVKAAGYSSTILGTPGVVSYWRMGESSGSSLANSVPGKSAVTLTGGTLGVAGALSGDANTAVRFNGSGNAGSAGLDLSGTQATTIELWLKWNAWANDDALAMELTSNFNGNAGGLLIDPNASNGSFGVAIGSGDSRNTSYFARPSAGQWHHYVFVLDATTDGTAQVIPYVDGQPVSYFKGNMGTGAGAFANSQLYFMSRAGAGLFGGGDLDEVSVYDRALSAQQVVAHHAAGS